MKSVIICLLFAGALSFLPNCASDHDSHHHDRTMGGSTTTTTTEESTTLVPRSPVMESQTIRSY